MAARVAESDGVGRLPTGTVTFLLTDLEASTRLWEDSGEVAAVAIARHYQLLEAAIALHGGVRPLEQGEGDSVVAAFTTASDALAAALDVQRAFSEEPWPEGRELRVRIALHTGEAHLRDAANYFGPTIIRCARLRSIAHGAQTLLSDATRDLVVDQLAPGITLRDLGSHRLKDLGRPERVWQLCHADLANDFPPLRSLDALPNNLPVQLSTFVGRDEELAQVGDALKRSRLVTLTGSGGCGKTRLALQVAAEVADRHDDGVWWVELAPVSRPELVAHAVAAALGLREEHGRPLEETLAEQLRDTATLLVLDNCEQVLDAAARLVDGLLAAAPGLKVLATSREPLGIPGELGWRVPPLDEASAVLLFVDRAQQVRPTFAPTPAEIAVLAQICDRLDGIPLAIELAAARTRMMNPARIASALADRFRLLTGGSRTVMPRQQTLEASVSWSHDLLDDLERGLVRRLSVFAGGFTLEAAEAVAADEMIDSYAVLDLLARLVDKSLVQVDYDQAEARYRLLETIRQYMSERLVESGESDVTRNRHLTHYLAVVERAAPELVSADLIAWLDRLDREHDNIRTALEWAAGPDQSEHLLRMVTSLTLFYEYRGHLGSGGRWFSRALAAVEDAEPTVVHARALWGAAHVAVYGDDLETAAQRAPEALAMAEAVGDEWAMARALNTIGYLQMWSEPEAARAALQQSVELGQQIGDDWAVADGLKMITVAWLFQEDHQGVRQAFDDLLRVASRLGNDFFIAWYHAGIGWLALRQGDFDTARHELDLSIEHSDRVGDPATRGLAIAWLSHIDGLTGEGGAATARLEELLARASASGGSAAVPEAVVQLATLAVGRGNTAAARELLQPFADDMRGFGMLWPQSWAQSILGAALLAEGDAAAASIALDEAKTVARSLDNAWLISLADHWLGKIARRAGDTSRAEQLHHEALHLQHRQNLRLGIVESLEALAALASDHESPAEAARLFGAADGLRLSIGMVRSPAEQTGYDDDLCSAHAQLAGDEFDAAWSQGAALSMDDAVEYASRARGERKRPSSGWTSLTPTEDRVVALAAEGLTNPQIAERLFVARGTVKVHLGHIFTKLGVTTRAELAAEATRRTERQGDRSG